MELNYKVVDDSILISKDEIIRMIEESHKCAFEHFNEYALTKKPESAAAKAKWEQEKVKATEVTKAEQEREVARLSAEKAEFDKKRIIAEGEAEAAANRAKVAAGLTPQEKIEWEYKTKVGVAEALSKTKWPTIVMGGSQSGGSNAMDVIALKQMTDLVEKMSK